MSIQFFNESFPAQSQNESFAVAGLEIPPATLEAFHKAQGALLRSVYAAVDKNRGLTAAVLGFHRPHTAQMKLLAFSGSEELRLPLLKYVQKIIENQGLVAKLDKTADDGTAPYAEAYERHYRQTTDFTCGPVATLGVLARKGIVAPRTREAEITLWRKATMGVACGPYALAVYTQELGAQPEIWCSSSDIALDPETEVGIIDKLFARDVQEHFKAEALVKQIPVYHRGFDATIIKALLDAGHMVCVLVDEIHWHGERCPHWVAVVRHDDSFFYIEDPWTDEEFGETAVDAYEFPILPADLELVSSYNGVQAMLVF